MVRGSQTARQSESESELAAAAAAPGGVGFFLPLSEPKVPRWRRGQLRFFVGEGTWPAVVVVEASLAGGAGDLVGRELGVWADVGRFFSQSQFYLRKLDNGYQQRIT